MLNSNPFGYLHEVPRAGLDVLGPVYLFMDQIVPDLNYNLYGKRSIPRYMNMCTLGIPGLKLVY